MIYLRLPTFFHTFLSIRHIQIAALVLTLSAGQVWAFTDVTSDHWAYDDISTLASTSITSGCDSENYCPDNTLQRSEMAIFLLRAIEGSDYAPPTASGTVFDDVSSDYWAGSFVEEFADRGITSGCDGSNYCPSREITRAEMAIFLVRSKYGTDYSPSAATGTVYGDIASDYWAGAYIEQLASDGYLDGTIEPGRECDGEGYFCPSLTINRAEMAVFLVQTFGLGESDSGSTDATLPGNVTLVDIPGGTFTMGGNTTAGDASEVSVTLSDFAISEKEITNAQYLQFLNAALQAGWVAVELQQVNDPCGSYSEYMVVGAGDAPNSGEVFLQLGETGGCTSDGYEEHIDNKSWIAYSTTDNTFELLDNSKSDWPINWVKWYGAYAFAEFYGVSLPTEAQWEYAARGGQQLEYPTDDGTLDSTKANYNGDTPGVHNEEGHSLSVGSYAANPYGLYDMGGNVWEWCQDYYDADFYAEGALDPLNTTPGADLLRVRRGGSWNYHAATLLTYARASDYPNVGNNHFGFRIAENE
ncbi:MAG: SUMF1/EgtB/PvdO family nonheme iron enzyme [Magnetococcales bacterium]|nr:SUMF1/EgtB/PvdO family nonheme iron enzyme [Magnetococcales bacterium]